MPFINISDYDAVELAPGARARTPYGKHVMLSYLELDEGAVVPMHAHPHEQAGLMLEGKIVGTPENARNERSALSLDARRGSLTGHFVVGNIPTQLVQHLQDGQLVRIIRLRLQRGEESVLVWRDHSSRITQIEMAGPTT